MALPGVLLAVGNAIGGITRGSQAAPAPIMIDTNFEESEESKRQNTIMYVTIFVLLGILVLMLFLTTKKNK